MVSIKICMLAPEFLPVWGGVGSYIVELVRHLPRDIEVHIVTPFRKSLGRYRISSDEYDYSKYFGSNVHIHFVSKAYDTFFYNASFQYAVAVKVPKLVKNEGIDLIHSHMAHMPDLLLQLRNIKRPIVTTIHTTIKGQKEGIRNSGMSFWELELSEKMTLLMYPFLRLVERMYLTKNRYYITVSNWMKEQLLRYNPKLRKQRIYVIHNAVDTRFFSPASIAPKVGITEDKEIILFTGRLIAAKGVHVLVRAIPKILKEYKNAFFLFIGPGNPEPFIRELEKKNIPRSNYKFLGYVKHREELVYYYRVADIFVAPTFYENLPTRILEAMSCAVPVVATKVCAIPEAVDNYVNGILVSPGSVHELANAIIYLLENYNLRKKMGQNARNKVLEKFDWNNAAYKTAKVYKDIIETT